MTDQNQHVRRLIRQKLMTLICCLLVGGVAGAIWSWTSAPRFSASSAIAFIQTNRSAVTGDPLPKPLSVEEILSQFRALITSEPVVESTLSRLPKEHRIDFKGLPKALWTSELRKHISFETESKPGSLSVAYQSKDRKTATIVLNAIVESSLASLAHQNQQNFDDQRRTLNERRAQAETELRKKEQELLELKHRSGNLLPGENKTPPVIQNSIQLNEAWIEAMKFNLQRLRDESESLTKQSAASQLETCLGWQVQVTPSAAATSTPRSAGFFTVILVSMLLGGLVGLCLIYARNVPERRGMSAQECESRLGLPLLATIQAAHRAPGIGLDALVTHVEPVCAESRSYQLLCRSISSISDGARRLAVTSAESNDGKTIIAANLALTYAQAGMKTLLIDADFFHSELTQLLGLSGSQGLTSILCDTNSISDSCLENIFNLGAENLDVLPSGAASNNSPELLAHSRLCEIIAWAGTIYDQILIDAPPVSSETDVSPVGRIVDGAVLVIRPTRKYRQAALRAATSCRAANLRLVGVVSNQDVKQTRELNQDLHHIGGSEFSDTGTNEQLRRAA